jgi:hypothetical protein
VNYVIYSLVYVTLTLITLLNFVKLFHSPKFAANLQVITKNIFLVEDDEDDQQFFIEAIKDIDKSISIFLAKNGADALTSLIR